MDPSPLGLALLASLCGGLLASAGLLAIREWIQEVRSALPEI